MRRIILCAVIVIMNFSLSFGQGIEFRSGLTWTDLLAKAKAEHKFIFIDCYATWCGPCKQMDQVVYPQNMVGEVYNPQFISIRVQMDRTKQDNDVIREGYAMADTIGAKCKINAYPTFLVLDENGQPVHKAVGYHNATELIRFASDSKNPEKQYYHLLKDFQPGRLDTAEEKELIQVFLNDDQELAGRIAVDYLSRIPEERLNDRSSGVIMVETAKNPQVQAIALNYIQHHDLKKNIPFIGYMMEQPLIKNWGIDYISRLSDIGLGDENNASLVNVFYGDSLVQQVVKNYLKRLPDDRLYTKANLGYLALVTQTPDDKQGFDLFYSHASRVDSVMRKNFAHDQVESAIKRAEYDPKLNTAKQTGTPPDFQAISLAITNKYKRELADDIIATGKPQWYSFLVYNKKETQYWSDLIDSHIGQVKRFRYDTTASTAEFINGISYAEIFPHGNKEQVETGIHWMRNVVNHYHENYMYIDTYASLLYKAGYNKQGLEWANNALQIARSNHSEVDISYARHKIASMEKGEQIWTNPEYL